MDSITVHHQINRDLCRGDYVVWETEELTETRVRERIITFSGIDFIRECNRKEGSKECEIRTLSKSYGY